MKDFLFHHEFFYCKANLVFSIILEPLMLSKHQIAVYEFHVSIQSYI